ncbi:MAG: hypothetical protein ACN6I6_01700 [bacterium]
MFKKKTLVAALTTLLCLSPIFATWARTQAVPGQSYAPDSEIPHAIGVYITKNGQEKIFNGLPALMRNNGLSVSQAYFHKQHFEMEEKSLEEMLPSEGALRDAALKIKETLQRFLMGLEFEKHKFAVDIEGIDLNIDWSDVHIELDPLSKMAGKLKLKLVLVTEGMDLNVAKIRASDLGNDFLGEVGVDKFSLYFDQGSKPLRIEVPIEMDNNPGSVGPSLRIGQLKSNIDEIALGANFQGGITLPEIEIRINGRVIRANYSELENMLKQNEEKIVAAIKKSMNSWVTDDAAAMVNEMISGKTKEGLFQEINVMEPAGIPEGQIVAPFQWGIKLKNYNFVNDSLHLTLDGYLKDDAKGSTPFARDLMALQAPVPHRVSEHHDFVLSVNQGFVNRIVQLSYNRGYFNTFDTEDGETYKIAKVPEFKLKNADEHSPARLGVELEYTVTGVGATLVNNPIRINFDMFLDFPVEDGQIKIIATEIDMDSVHVDKKYIKRFLGLMSWSGVVMPQVRKRFKDAQNDVRGMILADEFPIPESMAGIPLNIVEAQVDPNGHLMINIDTQLD